MAHVRAALQTLLAAALAVVVGAGLVSGQPPLPARTPQMNEVSALKGAGPISKDNLPKAKLAFEAFAKFYAEYVSNPKVHSGPQEFRPDPVPPGTPPPPLSVDALIVEINRSLLVPSPVPVYNQILGQPSFNTASGKNDADYVRELGAALDKALGDVVKSSPDRVVRVNAARLLAAACRSGAHAHYPTVTELLTAPNLDPELRYYALQAAANLLAAYDLNDYPSRKHSHGPAEVGALVAAVQNAVLKPDALVPLVDVPDGKGGVRKVVAPDQVPVLQIIRRQGVKALAQVRFAELDVDKKKLYPAHTLALVALTQVPIETFKVDGEKIEVVYAPKSISDSADAGEAVLGILNMVPPKGGAAAKQYATSMADVVATGVITWATPRATTPTDKSLPWKGTSARLEDGLKTWQGLFDANFNPAQPAVKSDLVPPPADGVSKAVMTNIVTPIGQPTGTVSITGLQTYQRDERARNKAARDRPFPAPDAPTLPLP